MLCDSHVIPLVWTKSGLSYPRRCRSALLWREASGAVGNSQVDWQLAYALTEISCKGPVAWPIAQIKPTSSRATAVQACTETLPR
jgi:hypothetical protein